MVLNEILGVSWSENSLTLIDPWLGNFLTGLPHAKLEATSYDRILELENRSSNITRSLKNYRQDNAMC